MKDLIVILILIVSLIGCATQIPVKVDVAEKVHPVVPDNQVVFDKGIGDYSLWIGLNKYEKRIIVLGYIYGMRVLYQIAYKKDMGWAPHPYEVVAFIDSNLDKFINKQSLGNMIGLAARYLQKFAQKAPGMKKNGKN